MGSFRSKASETGSVVVVRLNCWRGDDGGLDVGVSEVFVVEGVGSEGV